MVLSVDVHLTALAVKLQTEPTAIAQQKAERLAPLRTAAGMFHTIAQAIAQTMTALHDHRIGLLLQLVGDAAILDTLLVVELTSQLVRNVIAMGLWIRRTRRLHTSTYLPKSNVRVP